jgi:hypothetical protein
MGMRVMIGSAWRRAVGLGARRRGFTVAALALLAGLMVCASSGCRRDADPAATDHAATHPAPANASDPAAPRTASGSELDRLRSMGYLGFGDEPEGEGDMGVVLNDRARSTPGYSLYTTRNLCRADLIDWDGRIVHTWQMPEGGYVERSVLLPNGDLLAIGANRALTERYLMRQSWKGEVLWKRDLDLHHDITPTPGGGFTALALTIRRLGAVSPVAETRDDLIVRLTDDGTLIEEFSLYDMCLARPEVFPFQTVAPAQKYDRFVVDLFHSNSVYLMSRAGLAERDPFYASDNILVSIRHQDRVAVFDVKKREVVWAWGEGELIGPHDASVLPGGRVMIFDNGLGRGWSRVIELDPLTRKIEWEYKADPPQSFYTPSRGSCQRMANGNTLITESDRGRSFEVTPAGEIVWEFRNPHLDAQGRRATMVRLYRVDTAMVEKLLAP